jgi:hypothetical protein
MTFSTWFDSACVLGFPVALIHLVLRRRRESPTRMLVHGEPVIFATKAVAMVYVRGTWGHGWGGLNERGTQELIVHAGGLELTPGRFDGVVPVNTMLLEGSTMCRERLGI